MPRKAKITLAEDKTKRQRTGILPEVVDHQHRQWQVVVHDEPNTVLDHENRVAYVPKHVEIPAEALYEDHDESEGRRAQAEHEALRRRAEKFRLLTRIRVSPPGHPDWARSVTKDTGLIDSFEDLRAAKIAADTAYKASEYELFHEVNSLDRPEQVPQQVVNEVKTAWIKGDLRRAAALAVEHCGTGAASTISEAVNDIGQEALDKIGDDWDQEYREVYGLVDRATSMVRSADNVTYRDSVLAAKVLEDLPTVRTPGRRSRKGGEIGEAQSFDDLVESSHGDPLDGRARYGRDSVKDAINEARKKLNEAMEKAGVGKVGEEGDSDPTGVPFELDSDDVDKPEQDDGDDLVWGEVYWTKPPLVRNMLLGKVSRKPRPSDEGAVIRNMHRWYSDRRIFNRKRKLPGGTLLMDLSGSMSLTAAQINEIIDAAPHATVVAYSGSGDRGEMKRLAEKGKRVADNEVNTFGGGNVIDMPALEWLAKQEEPRVWVSDGLAIPASTRGNRGTLATAVEVCRDFARKHRIVRMRDHDEAVRLLRLLK
jgi:vacuolar-type H+-ATPase subunit H